jgi:ribosome-binding factor A
MSDYRQRQMEKHLQREISRIIRDKFKEDDFKMLSVTHVEVSPDYREATVHVSHIERDEETRERTLKLLKRRDNKIREWLARDLDLKHIPELRFREDTSIKEAAEVTDILQELEEEREERDSEQEI